MQDLRPAVFWCSFAVFLAYPTVATAASDPVVVVTPHDGEVVPAQFPVKVTYGSLDYCEETCMEVATERVTLYANAMWVASLDVPPGSGEVMFDIMLVPGQYDLVAEAEWSEIASALSDAIHIIVAEGATTGGSESSTGGSSAGESSTTISDSASGETSPASATSNTETGKHDGCGCVAPSGATHGLVWFAGIALLRGRRRRVPPDGQTLV